MASRFFYKWANCSRRSFGNSIKWGLTVFLLLSISPISLYAVQIDDPKSGRELNHLLDRTRANYASLKNFEATVVTHRTTDPEPPRRFLIDVASICSYQMTLQKNRYFWNQSPNDAPDPDILLFHSCKDKTVNKAKRD